jgi:hypothetical protein
MDDPHPNPTGNKRSPGGCPVHPTVHQREGWGECAIGTPGVRRLAYEATITGDSIEV